MRFQPSSTTELTPVPPAGGDDFFDVTDDMAARDTAREADRDARARGAARVHPTPRQVLKRAARKLAFNLDPRTARYDRGAGLLLLAALLAWPVVAALVAIADMTHPALPATASGLAGAAAGTWLLLTAREELFSRVHTGLLVAAGLCAFGWLPQQGLLTVVAPALVAYGLGSWIGILHLAITTPARPPSTTR